MSEREVVGPWDDEPDFQELECNGFSCAIVKHDVSKHLCGYVRIPEGHPLYHHDYGVCGGVDVHGGLTFSGQPYNVVSGERLDGWWVGFDCNHYGDLNALSKRGRSCWVASVLYDASGVYRNSDFVRLELYRLTEQLREVGDASQ